MSIHLIHWIPLDAYRVCISCLRKAGAWLEMAVAMIFIALLALKLSFADVPTPGHWILIERELP